MSFGSLAATDITFVSAQELRVVAPAGGHGVVNVRVSTPAGFSPVVTNDLHAYDPPIVTKLTPTEGPVSGGNTVTISGANFAPGVRVVFDRTPAAATSFVSTMTLRVTAPAGALAAVNVRVTTPLGSSPITPQDFYTCGGFQSGLQWTRLHPSASPPNLTGAAMAFDPASGGLVLFGGQTPTRFTNATWLWTGSTWMRLHPAHNPAPVEGASLAYDAATDQLVLFGGQGCNPNGYCTGTWIWKDGDWRRVSNAAAPVQVWPAMTYDPATQQLLLFGADPSACVGCGKQSTWSWDGAQWHLIDTTGPALGIAGSMAYDQTTKSVIMYGGDNAHDVQTWSWNGSGWTQLAATGPWPTSFGSMVPNPLGGVVRYGGYGWCHPEHRTYVWRPTIGAWGIQDGSSPTSRAFAVMAYDPLTNEDILFGGTDYDPVRTYRDTWALGLQP